MHNILRKITQQSSAERAVCLQAMCLHNTAARPHTAKHQRRCAVPTALRQLPREQRTGLMGPALLPESLERTRAAEVLRVIKEGRQATQMMGFGDLLSGAEIQALADWIRTPVVPAPRWTAADIAPRASPPRCPPDAQHAAVAGRSR